jgi:hypothetical protein
MAAFTATHGVKFTDEHGDWAHFVRDEQTPGFVYRFETTDTKVLARLRKVEGWGITEVKAAAKSDK